MPGFSKDPPPINVYSNWTGVSFQSFSPTIVEESNVAMFRVTTTSLGKPKKLVNATAIAKAADRKEAINPLFCTELLLGLYTPPQ